MGSRTNGLMGSWTDGFNGGKGNLNPLNAFYISILLLLYLITL